MKTLWNHKGAWCRVAYEKPKGRWAADYIINEVCERSGYGKYMILSRTRERDICEWRQILCYCMFKANVGGSSVIGRVLKLHHSTVLWAISKCDELISIGDPSMTMKFNKLEDIIRIAKVEKKKSFTHSLYLKKKNGRGFKV